MGFLDLWAGDFIGVGNFSAIISRNMYFFCLILFLFSRDSNYTYVSCLILSH